MTLHITRHRKREPGPGSDGEINFPPAPFPFPYGCYQPCIVSVDAFLDQARLLDRNTSSSPIGFWVANSRSREMTHPVPVLRAREVDRWASSSEYKSIMRKGRARSQP